MLLNTPRKKFVPYSLMHGGQLEARKAAAAPSLGVVGKAIQLKHQKPFVVGSSDGTMLCPRANAVRASPSVEQIFLTTRKKSSLKSSLFPFPLT